MEVEEVGSESGGGGEWGREWKWGVGVEGEELGWGLGVRNGQKW